MVLTSGWGEVDGIAQIAVAIGTITLAGFTYGLARRTHELAAMSKDQVDASLREAKATEGLALEARTDRHLAWRPQLELRDLRHTDQWSMRIGNSGAGPALDVIVAARDMTDVGEWCLIRCGDLRPGDHVERAELPWQHGNSLTSTFEGFSDLNERRVVTIVMMCTDVLGRRLRFGIADPKHPFPGEVSTVLPVEISTQDHRLAWATEPLIWG